MPKKSSFLIEVAIQTHHMAELFLLLSYAIVLVAFIKHN